MIEVYYAEDDQAISSAVKEYLERRGYRVTIFSTIAAAKQAVERSLPQIMLVDWNMPDGNGRGLCQWIRANWKELPVIFLTVRGDSRDIVSGFQEGADDYVVKPFELDVLHQRMLALLRRTGDVAKQYLSCGHIALDRKRVAVTCEGRKSP